MLQEIAIHAAHSRSFSFETTFASESYVRMIDDWGDNRYLVKLIFLSLTTAGKAIKRVAVRGKQAGHDIPTDTIRQQFDAGLRHFRSVYPERVDSWHLFDNDGEQLLLIEEGGI